MIGKMVPSRLRSLIDAAKLGAGRGTLYGAVHKRGMLSVSGYFWGDPLVTVIIPTHNRAQLLMKRALPSVRAQTYKNLEIIVAAHGCTDATMWAVDSLIPKGQIVDAHWHEPRLRVLHVARRQTYPPTAENHWFAGPVAPLNAALKVARGKWIARCDDDDTLEPDHIESLLRFAQAGNYEFVSAAHDGEAGKVEPYIVNGNSIGGCQTWLYRDYLKAIRYNPRCWANTVNKVNDTDLQQRFVNLGVRMGYLDRVVAHVLPRPGETVIGLKAYQQNRAETERKLAFK